MATKSEPHEADSKFFSTMQELIDGVKTLTLQRPAAGPTQTQLRPSLYNSDQDWDLWFRRFQLYANEITQDEVQQKGLLISRLGDVPLQTLFSSDPRLERSYQDTVQFLTNRFSEEKGSCESRLTFNSLSQKISETLDEYLTRVQKCVSRAYPDKDKDFLEVLVTDKFVMGIQSSSLKEILLSEVFHSAEEALAFAKRKAKAAELCKKTTKHINVLESETNRTPKPIDRNAIQRGQPNSSSSSPRPTNLRCHYCGIVGHVIAECRNKKRDAQQSNNRYYQPRNDSNSRPWYPRNQGPNNPFGMFHYQPRTQNPAVQNPQYWPQYNNRFGNSFSNSRYHNTPNFRPVSRPQNSFAGNDQGVGSNATSNHTPTTFRGQNTTANSTQN